MAMNGDALGTAIKTAIESVTGGTIDAQGLNIWKAIAGEIVTHIQTSAKGNGVDSNGDTHSTMGIV